MSHRRLLFIAAFDSPYFDHFYRRVVAELDSVNVHVLLTHTRQVWEVPESRPYSCETIARLADYPPNALVRRLAEFRVGRALCERARQWKPDAAVLLGYRDLSRLRFMRWCHSHRLPVLAWSDVNVRGSSLSQWKIGLKQQYLSLINRQLSAWLVCGSAGEEYLAAFQVSGDRVFRVPCEPCYRAIDELETAAVDRAHDDMSLAPHRRRLICSGRLIDTKRFDLVIRAFIAIAKQRMDWDLVVLGDGPLRAELQALVPEELRARVVFPGFVRQPQRVWAAYKACDALVHLADHEPWGLIVNEAAACELAMICTDVVGSAIELVRDGVNGRVVRRGDLSHAIEAMLDVTDAANIARYRAQSKPILEAWRAQADPIAGLRSALRHVRASEHTTPPAPRQE